MVVTKFKYRFCWAGANVPDPKSYVQLAIGVDWANNVSFNYDICRQSFRAGKFGTLPHFFRRNNRPKLTECNHSPRKITSAGEIHDFGF